MFPGIDEVGKCAPISLTHTVGVLDRPLVLAAVEAVAATSGTLILCPQAGRRVNWRHVCVRKDLPPGKWFVASAVLDLSKASIAAKLDHQIVRQFMIDQNITVVGA